MGEHEVTPIRKTEGIANESFFVLPLRFLAGLEHDDLFAPLRVTDIGFFPKARHHDRTRSKGCHSAILLYCRDGEGFYRLGRFREQAMHAGQALLIPPNTPHRYRASEDKPWSLYWMHVEGDMLPAYLGLFGPNPLLTIHPRSAGEILREFHRCFDLLAQHCQSEEYFLVCQSAGTILALIVHAAKLSRLQLTEKGEQAVEACIRHMEAHLDQPLRMSRLTELSGFSESHLGTLFKQATGHPPMAHFHRMKMQAAARELAFTDKSVKEIGLACGIQDPYYFSRLFKSVMGVSPVKYRERAMG
jgi:AraC-like DNA-binding protein